MDSHKMKICIVSPDSDNWIDPPVASLLRHMDGRVDSPSDADVCIVPITYGSHFRFNGLSQLSGRKWVLVDYSEFGWDWNQQCSYLWGNGDRMKRECFGSHPEYQKLQQFILDNPPILTFQRELLRWDVSDRVLPIEYLSWLPVHGNDTKEDFLKRPLDVSYVWSRSHESRMHVHGAIFQTAGKFGYDVISDFSHVDKAIQDNPSVPKWLSAHVPHYARIDVRDCQNFIRRSKITIAMPGCGVKCFRHGENCGDAIMAMPRNNLAWSYPWTHENSIHLYQDAKYYEHDATTGHIANSLMRPDLYNIYCAAMDNAQNYRPEAYLRRHVAGNIQKFL